MKKVIFLSCVFLSACSTIKHDSELIEINPKFDIDYKLTSCEDFPIFKGSTFGELYQFVVLEVSKEYKKCSNKAENYKKIIENN